MSNIAISELNTETTNVSNDDLLLLSKYDNSNQTYTSSKLKASNFKNYLVSVIQQQLFDILYPIGSVYISVSASEQPFQNINGITCEWERLSTGKTLWNSSDDTNLGGNLNGILPKHTHTYTAPSQVTTEDIHSTTSSSSYVGTTNSNTGVPTISSGVTDIVIGNSLRPPSIAVSMWKRIS